MHMVPVIKVYKLNRNDNTKKQFLKVYKTPLYRNVSGQEGASQVAQLVKNPPAMQKTPGQFLEW